MFLLFAGWWASACTGDGLTVEDQTSTDDSGGTVSTSDTAPEPPCPHPEAEPNDVPADATPLVMEQRMCGVLAKGDVVDVFSLELDDDGWVEIEVQGDQGSILEPAFFFQGAEIALRAESNVARPEPMRRLELPAGAYTLAVSDRNAGSGSRYTYRALVSEIKAPAKWNRDEVEPNDVWSEAQILVHDDGVHGFMNDGDAPDQDWYRIAVPGGRHDLVIDVDAMEHGSSANLAVEIYDETLDSVRRIEGGSVPASFPDPDGRYGSSGNEVLFLQVTEQGGTALGGPDRWYVLHVELEAQ